MTADDRAPGTFYRLSLELVAGAYPDRAYFWQERMARQIVAEVRASTGTRPADPTEVIWSPAATGRHGSSIEVALIDNLVMLRDSVDPDGAILSFSRTEWNAFVDSVRSGELERPSAPVISAIPLPTTELTERLDRLEQWLATGSMHELVLAVAAIEESRS